MLDTDDNLLCFHLSDLASTSINLADGKIDSATTKMLVLKYWSKEYRDILDEAPDWPKPIANPDIVDAL